MKHFIIGAAVATAFLGGSVIASAQDNQDKQTPGAGGQAPPASSAQPKSNAPAAKSDSPAGRKSDAHAAGIGDQKSGEPSRGATSGEGRQKRQERAQSRDSQGKGERARADRTDKGKGFEDKSTAGREPIDKSAPTDRSKKADQPTQGKTGKAEANKDSKGHVQLSQDQRARVGQTLRQQKVAHVTQVNFSINVGSRIPRSVRLHAMPASVISIVPEYRSFRFILVEDRICIVDPSTYEIVYVVDEPGVGTSGRRIARLELSAEQRHFILSAIPADRTETNLRVNLALGAEVPGSVQLFSFPDVVVKRVPDIRSYRYVTSERLVIVVDPDTRDIVLIIER